MTLDFTPRFTLGAVIQDPAGQDPSRGTHHEQILLQPSTRRRPIKAVSKAATPQAGHSHTSHCCDNGAQASGVANPTRHDHQGQSGADGPGMKSPQRHLRHRHSPRPRPRSSWAGHAHTAAATEPPLTTPEQNSRRHSWQVLGMDCPSCARKIETAVSRVEGVQQARCCLPPRSWWWIWPPASPRPRYRRRAGRRLPAQGGAQNTARSEPGRSPLMQRSATCSANTGSPCRSPA